MGAPGWHRDPAHIHELRYFDGAGWTDQVSDQGLVSSDALPEGPARRPAWATDDGEPGRFVAVPPEKVRAQVTRTTGADPISAGTGDVFREPTLVVNQRFKLTNVNNDYSIFDAEGERIAAVRPVDPPDALTVAVSHVLHPRTPPLHLVDRAGQPLLLLTTSGSRSRPTVTVEHAGAGEVGRLVKENALGRTSVAMIVDDQRWGSMHAEDLQNRCVSVRDHAGTEVARLAKTFAGFPKAMFVTGDNYVVQVHPSLGGPLRMLVVAATVSILTSFRPSARLASTGTGGGGASA